MILTLDFGPWTLDQYFYQSVFDDDCVDSTALALVRQWPVRTSKRQPCQSHSTVCAAELAVSQGRSLVRAEILDGMKLSADVVKGQFRSVQKLYGRAASRRYVFDTPDRYGATLARRFFEVAKP